MQHSEAGPETGTKVNPPRLRHRQTRFSGKDTPEQRTVTGGAGRPPRRRRPTATGASR
jgi:hypothetical protein